MENWLLSFADGHGGIQTIEKTGTSALVDTYTITFSDATTSTFTVTNGRSISNLTSSKSGKVTTVTITYNDGTTSTLTVRDGEDVSSITEYWAVSTSGSTTPQSWQTTPQTLTATYKYLWHYTRYTYTDGTFSSTTPAVQGVYGDKGDTGATGTSITGIAKTGTSGLVDTYTVTMSNGTTTTFTVTNGSEIESVVKTSTAGLVDTYTVTMGNGETHTFTVTNGRSIVSFTQTSGTHAAGTIDVYTITYNDGDTSQIQVYNGANGTGAVSSVAGIGVSGSAGDVPLIIQDYGAPTTATVGQVNQLYFDKTGGIMYICISTAGGTYDWRGMSSAVDSALSTTSANPVQNRIISAKVGVGSLSSEFSATNLTDAANELQTNKANLASPTFTGTPKAPTAAAGTNNTQLATTAFVQNIASDLNGAINSITPFDATPTSGSSKGITSGAVATAFDMLKISGLEAYYSLSSLASYLGTLNTGYMAIVRIASSAASQFFESGTSLPTLCYCLKAGATNVYFLAVSRDSASIGNINISTGTINYLYDLAIADNSLGLNSSISYPAYFTCGIWRTSSDGTINLQFPCTSLKESNSYTTTSTISINLFLPGSADAAIQLLNKSITAVNRITTDNIILQIAAENDVPINRMGFFSTRTIMTITAD